MAVSEEVLIHVYQTLNSLKGGEAGKKVDELAAYYGVARQTIFRWASVKGLRWRKEKITKGNTKVSEDVLRMAGAMLYASRRTSNEIPLPTCDAKEMLEDSGFDTGVSTGRFLALMRERQISAQDILRPSPHKTLLSEHPNHVWQFDVTNCLQYFLDDRKGMGERDADMTLYKNKIVKTAKAIKKELLRFAVIDHCSGAFYFRYFYATGEKAADGAQFLFEAMRPKEEIMEVYWPEKGKYEQGKYRLHGVPFMMVADKGSIMKSKENENLFKALRIEVETHMPGNPRAKGAVEGLMKIINRFEARLKFERPSSLEELNMWALDWGIMYNSARDIRGVAPRTVLWSKIKPEQLRLCPEEIVYRMLIRKPTFEAKADGARLIRVDNRTYQIPDPNCVKQWVTVSINAYEYPALDVHYNGHVWLCQPIEKDEYGRLTTGVKYGEYKEIKHTETQAAKVEMEGIAEGWGLKWKGTGDKRKAEAPAIGFESPLKVFGHQAEKVGNISIMPKEGTALEIRQPEMPENRPLTSDAQEISRGIASRKISFIELLKKIRKEINRVSPELNQELKAMYAEGIAIKEAEEVIEKVASGQWPVAGEENTGLRMVG